MHFLVTTFLLMSHRAEPLHALDLGLGIGFIRHDAESYGFGQELFIGVVPELSFVQKIESLWIEFGISALGGSGLGTTSGLWKDEIRGGGFHIDAAYSFMRSSYLELKLGVGAGAKLLHRVHEENTMDEFINFHLVSRSARTDFQIAGRGMAALNIHGKDGIGGLEFRPLKGELGPSFFDITPSLAIYWPI